MNKETLRDISYIIHLLNPQSKYAKQQLQDLYANTAKIHDYTTSTIRDDGTAEFLTTDQRSSEATKYVFTGDSIILIHEFVNKITIDNFAKNAIDIVNNAIKVLRIPIFVEQRYIIRCNANPFGIDDSRKFIAEKVCSIKIEDLNPFARPVHGIGLRFFFPPTPEKANEFDVKIESLLKDPRCLYLECMGRYFQPVQQNNLDLIRINLLNTKQFVYDNMSNFLTQYNNKETK